MRNFFFIICLCFFSCKKKDISNLPFEVTKDISCDDLYEDGYKRTFKVDVLMIGKKIGDTIIHYELNTPPVKHKIDYKEIEENIPSELDTTPEINIHQKYLDQDPLILSDSLYNIVWQDINEQKKSVCDKSTVHWRNFILKIKKSEINNYYKTIDTLKYRIFDFKNHRKDEYGELSFKVLNLKKKDTFYCSIYNQNDQYYFSSTITIKNE